jgi:hypothetical protein
VELADIKRRWNEVLDAILERDRILWLAIFDARLASFSDHTLTLDFSDPNKFASEHDYSAMRDAERVKIVEEIVQNTLGVSLQIVIASGK